MQAGDQRGRAAHGKGWVGAHARLALLALLGLLGFPLELATADPSGIDVAGPVNPAAAVPEEILDAPPITRDVLQNAHVVHSPAPGGTGRLMLQVPVPPGSPELEGPLDVEYTLDPGLEKQVFNVIDRLDARLTNVVVLEAKTGRVLAYASSDPLRFPPTRIYPAASLIKVVTAAAALHHARDVAEGPCHFLGNPHFLSPQRVDPPRAGSITSLEGALAHSNNQCFAQLAVHALGTQNMVDAIRRFGFLQPPAPGHSAGAVDAGTDRYDLGKLGCGLTGCWITPMHAARMAMTLADGRQREPYWIEQVNDANGRLLQLPPRRPAKQVLTPELASELRTMMIETTVSGTAKRGFSDEDGAPMLGPVQVSGKTGTLRGNDPEGLYEWFAGVAPADDPKIAIAVVSVAQNGHRVRATKIASEVLEGIFCGHGGCRSDAVQQIIRADGATPSDHGVGLGESAAGG